MASAKAIHHGPIGPIWAARMHNKSILRTVGTATPHKVVSMSLSNKTAFHFRNLARGSPLCSSLLSRGAYHHRLSSNARILTNEMATMNQAITPCVGVLVHVAPTSIQMGGTLPLNHAEVTLDGFTGCPWGLTWGFGLTGALAYAVVGFVG